MVQYGPLKDWNEVTSDPPKRNSTFLILNLKQISTRKMQGIKFYFGNFFIEDYNYFPPLYLNILG